MEVTFQLTLEDLVQYNLYVVDHTATGRRSKILMVVLGPVLFTLVSALLSYGMRSTIPLAAFGIASVVWVVWYPIRWRYHIARNCRRLYKELWQNDGQVETTVRIDPKGIHQISARGGTDLNWSAVHRIEGDAVGSYFFVGTGGALILPNRAFSSSEEQGRFLAAAREWHEGAGVAGPHGGQE